MVAWRIAALLVRVARMSGLPFLYVAILPVVAPRVMSLDGAPEISPLQSKCIPECAEQNDAAVGRSGFYDQG